MDDLCNLYLGTIVTGTDESKMFSKFFSNDGQYVEEWVDNCLAKLQTKSNNRADELKQIGNKFYAKRDFTRSAELYTKALCYATPESEHYGLILANRSAVFYMKEDYENCVKDINLTLKSNFPENIRLKVLIRKIKCCSKMELCDQLNNAVEEAMAFLENKSPAVDKDKLKKEIVTASTEKPVINGLKNQFIDEIPKMKDGPNINFLSASSAIRLEYNEVNGRHVVANERLEPGDVLFVEKPFIFAPVFINEDMELSLSKCFNCLKTISSCIPCKYCVKCIFCDENCRDDCWKQFHKWECVGMQANLWYHVGIAYPALRALIKGIESQLCTLDSNYKADTVTYGNKSDNYGYFNKLVSNISKMKNVLPIIVSSSVVVLYLKRKTKFFEWLMDEVFVGKSINELMDLVGGRITKHIAQLQCNASVIYHDANSEDSVAVACAIYPSISMMNHSCKPNITLYHVRDTVVAEAIETIEANEEIFNCYGIDYRYMDWESRQERCSNLYYFNCQCRACKLPHVS